MNKADILKIGGDKNQNKKTILIYL